MPLFPRSSNLCRSSPTSHVTLSPLSPLAQLARDSLASLTAEGDRRGRLSRLSLTPHAGVCSRTCAPRCHAACAGRVSSCTGAKCRCSQARPRVVALQATSPWFNIASIPGLKASFWGSPESSLRCSAVKCVPVTPKSTALHWFQCSAVQL